jgi:hypothetical protein
MFLTGMVGDLPIEAQLHPEIQKRVEANLPVMDEATDRMSAYLRARSALELGGVQRALRHHEAGTRIITSLDEVAEDLGVSPWRREQTRSLFSSAEWRLRNQPPELVVSEYLEKVDRLSASDINRAAQQQGLAARLADEAFWAAQPQDPSGKTTRQKRISRGGKVMGIGVLIFAGGAGLVAMGDSGNSDGGSGMIALGLVAGTVGVLTFLVGLVILLVGLATPET